CPPCQQCQRDGTCKSTCGPCDQCLPAPGFPKGHYCQDVCNSSCERCQDGVCKSTCPSGQCCKFGACLFACDSHACEVCIGGQCQSKCQPCERCDGIGQCVQMCPPCQTCG